MTEKNNDLVILDEAFDISPIASEQAEKTLVHDLLNSPEVERVTLRELEQRVIRAENLAIKASNDAAVSAGEAERAAKDLKLAEDYARTCKSLSAEIRQDCNRTNIFCGIAAACALLVVIILAFTFLWR